VQQTTATTALATPPGFLLQTAHGGRVVELDAPHPTVCASDDRHALVVPMRRNGRAASTTGPVPTVTAGGQHHGLLMRNNTATGDPGVMVTPVTEPARTVTTKGHQSLLVPQDPPALDVERVVDKCGFRMLEPYEIAAAMAFPTGYIPRALPKKDQVKLAGNAVTPPVMTWIVGRILQALEAAS
jgi:DNA (cytosine-5)-methyltransferase 1